jgi:molecular chaperone HtpG
MDETTRHTFQLHLPGLLQVLAGHLYASKTVAIRELLQNAYDSCLRRTVEAPEPDYRPRIDLSVAPDRQALTIGDNGVGLTADEIRAYLATIGRSYTRELRERLAVVSPEEAAALIGQFCFGFLSAFLIASEVTVTTRSARDGSDALRWRSGGDEYYELSPGARDAPGTTIELRVKPSAAFLLQRPLLISTIQKYADLLPIPIHVDGSLSRVNLTIPPWEAIDAYAACIDYVKRTFDAAEPLCILPLRDQRIDLGHDTQVVPLRGFLFVPPRSVASVREYGDVRVYIRRMFICDGERDLLPPWARFVRGVIDCPILQPTASREGVHQDETFEAVQRALEAQLAQGLRRLAHEDPATWRRLVQSHSTVITAWAVRDTTFFDEVADLVAFRTSRGLLTLPDYLCLSGGILYYVTAELGSLQELTLAEGHGMPVIDASWFAVAPFLEKYTAQRPGVNLVCLDGNATRLLRPAPEAPFAGLLAAYRRRGVRSRVAPFEPRDMPAILLYPRDVEFVQDAQRGLDVGELAGGIAGLVGAYLEDLGVTDEDMKGILYLNAQCPLVQRLAADEGRADTRARVLTVLYDVARLFAGRTLSPADVAATYREMSEALTGLLG